jgi:hypothetical protein
MRSTLPALISPRRFHSDKNPPGFRKAAGLVAVAAGAFLGLSSAAHALVDISCQGGPGMTAKLVANRWEIGFMIGEGNQPNPGECVVGPGRGVMAGETPVLFIPLVANVNLVVEAATKGGTFQLKAQEGNGAFRVTFIGQVNVVDNTPLTPPGGGETGEPAQGGEGEGGGMAGGGEGGGMAVESSSCPAGTATVQTPAGIDFLNVRETPALDATIRAQVPNGSEVNVIGACIRVAAGLTKQKVKVAVEEWCRIDAPNEGCVKGEYLVFGDGIKPGQAGLVAPKKKKH